MQSQNSSHPMSNLDGQSADSTAIAMNGTGAQGKQNLQAMSVDTKYASSKEVSHSKEKENLKETTVDSKKRGAVFTFFFVMNVF